MKTEDYQYLYDLEAKLWWFAGMREITGTLLAPFLEERRHRRILDAGCGTGGNLEWLRPFAGSHPVIGLDYVETALRFCQKGGHQHLVQASATDLPFAAESLDVVTSFDVLVQIPGAGTDEQAISEMFRVLKPGGLAFVRCAAYEWMKSDHDAALATHRRYTLPELRGKLEAAGFTTLRATYAMTLLFPVAAARRLVMKKLGLADSGSDVKPLPDSLAWVNRALQQALDWEADLLQLVDLPFGLSAICVMKKP
ncbi:MAG: methyltransferase domain-containing protein [Acidobacteria bacterium]|nr:methyltransferase domain-containing protein [Acidobacteriota bacterium]